MKNTKIICSACAALVLACFALPVGVDAGDCIAANCGPNTMCDTVHSNILGDDANFYDSTSAGCLALYNAQTQECGDDSGPCGSYHTGPVMSFNTAFGSHALYSNGAGSNGNSALGAFSLYANTSGQSNTTIGSFSLRYNTTGNYNTATGVSALGHNTTGIANTAVGYQALNSITTSPSSTVVGYQALLHATSGGNDAFGEHALINNTIGIGNTAVGIAALGHNTTGFYNVGVGENAGNSLTTGNGNVCIGYNVLGVAGESNTTRIRNVYGSVVNGLAVYVDSGGKLGHLSSSRRYKEKIKPMDKASEAILALKPVSFQYKKEIDASATPQFGLLAEEVAEVNPELVTPDSEGKPETVRYDAVNAMLLNEFLKEHRKNHEQEATIAQLQATTKRQQTQIEALTAGLQKVSAHLEVSKIKPQTVANNQ